MSAVRAAVTFLLLGAVSAPAQDRFEDRPEVIGSAPRTKDEADRRTADRLLRDARALYGVGVLQRRQEKLIQAVKALERAAEIDPESIEICKALVPLYSTVGRDADAMVACRRVLDRDPCEADTAFQYGRLLKADGRPNEAVTILQKAVAGKAAAAKPERLLFMLSDLFDLLEKRGDYAAAAATQDAIITTIATKREELLFVEGFSRDDLQTSQARAYERLGRCCVRTKEFARAEAAFRGARDELLKSDDVETRRGTVRINRNLSEMAAAQGKYGDALRYLDSYLEHGPIEVGPYEMKADLLRKLGRAKDVLPTLRAYAVREEFNLGLQLLLARELAAEPRSRGEAEKLYLTLLERNVQPEVYKGLFRLFAADDRMIKALDTFDDAVRAATAKDSKPDDRESAQNRTRAILAVFRSEPTLAAAMLPVALQDLSNGGTRQIDTWEVLAALAAQARLLDKAEVLFRQCLAGVPPEHEFKVYVGLIDVLRRGKKHEAIVKLCRDAIDSRTPARNTNRVLFHDSLARALADLERFDEAMVHADEGVKLSSEDTHVRQRCHRAEILAQAGRFDEAVRECEATLKEFTQPVRVRAIRLTLSNVYSLKLDHARSEEQLRLVLETDPDQALANNNLGYQMAERNVNLDEAERRIRKAIAADHSARIEAGEDEEIAAYRDSLGWVLFRKGRLADARVELEKAAALPDGADDPTVWDHLGDAYFKLNEPAKAKSAWATAAGLYPSNRGSKTAARRAAIEKKLKAIE